MHKILPLVLNNILLFSGIVFLFFAGLTFIYMDIQGRADS